MPRSALYDIVRVAAAAATLACGASSGGGGVVPSGSAAPAPRTDRSVITADDLRASRETSLYNAIQRLRPDWLRTRGATSLGGGTTSQGSDAINVYMDQQRLGTVEVLKSMALTAASSLRFYSAADAQMRFGTGNPNGAIQIVTTTSP